MNKLNLGEFEVVIHQDTIAIKKPGHGSIEFNPANAENLIKTLNVIKPLKTLEVKPEEVNFSPFKVRFIASQFVGVTTHNDPHSELKITWDELNDLGEIARLGFLKFQDRRRFSSPRKYDHTLRVEGDGETYI